MLREFSDEIARLKAQLAGKGIAPGEPGYGTGPGVRREIREVEKIVEKEVIKEVQVGVSEEELQRVHEAAEAEKEKIRAEAERKLAAELERQARRPSGSVRMLRRTSRGRRSPSDAAK